MTIILAYLRLVSYAIVMLSSVMSVKTKRYDAILFLGDLILAFAFILGVIANPFGHADGESVRIFIITPGVVLWACFHFCNLVCNRKVKK